MVSAAVTKASECDWCGGNNGHGRENCLALTRDCGRCGRKGNMSVSVVASLTGEIRLQQPLKNQLMTILSRNLPMRPQISFRSAVQCAPSVLSC